MVLETILETVYFTMTAEVNYYTPALASATVDQATRASAIKKNSRWNQHVLEMRIRYVKLKRSPVEVCNLDRAFTFHLLLIGGWQISPRIKACSPR